MRARHATARDGKALHFFMNFSGEAQSFEYAHGPGTDLLAGKPVVRGSA